MSLQIALSQAIVRQNPAILADPGVNMRKWSSYDARSVRILNRKGGMTGEKKSHMTRLCLLNTKAVMKDEKWMWREG